MSRPLARLARRAASAFTLLDRLFRFRALFSRPARPADRVRLGVALLEDRVVPDGRPLPLPIIYTGTGQGPPPIVRAFDAVTGDLRFEKLVADPGFTGGVRIATADFTRDGIPDLVVSYGPGGGPRVQVLDGTTGEPVPGPLGSFLAYVPTFTGGVQVAAADVDGDGIPDVITAAGAGGGPHVQVFSGVDGHRLRSFFAFEPDFRGGVSVAAADFSGDGRADLAVGAGAGGGPRVRTFDLNTGKPLVGPLGDFFAFDPSFRGGVSVGTDSKAADVDADGTPDLVVGTGPGGPAQVEVFSGKTGAVLGSFAPFDPAMTAGVTVALAYVDNDSRADVVVGTGAGTPATVRVFSGATFQPVALPTAEFHPFGTAALGGVSLAASNDPVTPDMTVPQIDPSPATAGQPMTVSVTLTGTAGIAPSGSVWFSATDATQMMYTLGMGMVMPSPAGDGTATATVTTSTLAAGTYTVTANYSGDTTYAWTTTAASGVQVAPGSPPPPMSPPPPLMPPPPGPPMSPPPPGPGQGSVWLETDSDSVTVGEETTFWVSTAEDPAPDYTSVEWDFDYDGFTFQPSVTGTDWSGTTTFTATGPRTVAARVTDSTGMSQVLTLAVDVHNPAPEVTVPDDMTATAGVPVVLPVTATAPAGVTSVEWQFSQDGGDYLTDPTVTMLSPTYTFATAGEYDVWVTVTDAEGQTGEGGFHVRVTDPAPTATATVAGPVLEGDPALFTVRGADADAADVVTIYAQWSDSDPVEQLIDGDYTVNGDGSVSFFHTYVTQGTYTATFWVEDEWGTATPATVQVEVGNRPPPFTLTAGRQVATAAGEGIELWAMVAGDVLEFHSTDLGTAPDVDEDYGYVFHWRVGGVSADTSTPTFALPDYTLGKMYTVDAWVTDNDGTSTEHHPFQVMVDGGTDGFQAMSWQGVGTHKIYGSLTVDGEGPYNPFAVDTVRKTDWPVDAPVTVQFTLDPISQQLAAANGWEPEYHFRVEQYDVEQFTFWDDNHDLLTTDEFTNTTGTLTVGGWGEDREAVIVGWVDFLQNGQLVKPYVEGGAALEATVGQQVVIDTPKSPTWRRYRDALETAIKAAGGFMEAAPTLIQEIRDGVPVMSIFTSAFTGAVDQFVTDLPRTLQGTLAGWLFGPGGPATGFPSLNWGQLDPINSSADRDTLLSAFMQYAGLTWDHVYDVARQRLGAGNLAALDQVMTWFQGADLSNPASLLQTLGRIGDLDLGALEGQILAGIQAKVTDGVKRAGAEFAARFVPGAGAIMSLASGLSFIVGHAEDMAGLFDQFKNAVFDLADPAVGDKVAAVKARLLGAMEQSVGVFLSFAMGQLGLGGLPGQLRRAVEFVPAEVDKAIAKAVDSLARAARPGGGMFDGMLAPRREFQYPTQNGQTYVLWVVEDRNGGAVKVARKAADGTYQMIGELTAASFTNGVTPGLDGQTPVQHIGALVMAARMLSSASKQRPQPGPGGPANPLPDLKAKQAEVTRLEDLVVADIQADACKALNAGCFAAGTKLDTPTGFRAVEDFRPGDEVYSRHEHDPAGPVEVKVVEDVFRRTACVWHLHAGGQVVRTTDEHPFYAHDRGWVAVKELQPGDWVLSASGHWVVVEDVFDTGEWEPVYNVRVADHHTYFVGDHGWGFALWAHNLYQVGHLASGSNRSSVWRVDNWNVFSKEPTSGGAQPDRWVLTADGKGRFQFRNQADAQAVAQSQQVYEHDADYPPDSGHRFEKSVRRRTSGVTRYAEVIVGVDGTVQGEIDFETGSNIYECSTSYADKLDQLIKLCVVARLRGKLLIGVADAHVEGDQRFQNYLQQLNALTFSSDRAQYYLRLFTTDPSSFTDSRPLSDFFSGFQFM